MIELRLSLHGHRCIKLQFFNYSVKFPQVLWRLQCKLYSNIHYDRSSWVKRHYRERFVLTIEKGLSSLCILLPVLVPPGWHDHKFDVGIVSMLTLLEMTCNHS